MNKKHILSIIILVILSSIILLFTFFYKNNISLSINISLINNEKKKFERTLTLDFTQKLEETQAIDKNSNNNEIETKKAPNIELAILPYNFEDKKVLEYFYESLKLEYNEKIDKVIIISEKPENEINYFSSPKDGDYCYVNDCISIKSISDGIIPETKFFDGFNNKIGLQINNIKKSFSGKEIGLLFINPNDLKNSEILKNHLEEKYKNEAVLFLTFSDFSKINDIDYKELHNKKTFYTLNNSTNIEEYKNIDVSCVNCLYITNSIANENNKFPHKYRDTQNIIYYHKIKNEDNGITISFFGDMIYDRSVSLSLNTKEKYNVFLKDLFENSDISLDPKIYKNRKLFGIDFAGANMETPVITDKNECEATQKEIAFCSKKDFLPWIKDLGFNIFSVANNHSMDGGITAHKNTIKNLDNEGLKYFGYIRHGSIFEKNYINTGSIRGINYAWHSYDFTITKDLSDNYCKILKDYKDKGYLNFVTVHWGNEYKTVHNSTQEKQAKKLIDCGANLIIGGHPHVIQDIGEYNGVSIIYSLGNFIFDQNWSQATSIGAEAIIDYNLNGKVTLKTKERNVATKR